MVKGFFFEPSAPSGPVVAKPPAGSAVAAASAEIDGMSTGMIATTGLASDYGTSSYKVYMGTDPNTFFFTRPPKGAPYSPEAIAASEGQFTTTEQAMGSWYKFTEDHRSQLGVLAYNAGLIEDPQNYDQLHNLWNDAVIESANALQYAGAKISPWDVVNMRAGIGGTERKPTTRTSTNRQENLPSLGDIDATLQSISRDMLGRDLNGDELAKYRAGLVRAAKANPSITTQTQVTDVHGNSSTNSRSSGGLDLTKLASEQFRATDEYQQYQEDLGELPMLQRILGTVG